MDSWLGSITLFAFNWAPQGFASCAGQQLQIQQNAALYSLLGIQFGGNGSTTFNLPDLRGRVPVGYGQGLGLPNIIVGENLGAATMTLSASNIGAHTHLIAELQANKTAVLHAKNANADKGAPPAHYLAAGVSADGTISMKMYSDQPPDTTLASDSVTLNTANLVAAASAANQAFGLYQPSLGMGYCIATEGLYPSRP